MPVITLSGRIKSGKVDIAAKLSKMLGYPAIYKEIISECSRKYNFMEEELLDNLDEIPRLWNRLSGTHHRQLIYIKCALLDAIKNDNVIYYGPYGQLLLSDIHNVIKIKIETPFNDRVHAVMSEKNINYEEAVEYVSNRDKIQTKLVKILYDTEWQDPEHYDLSFNLRNLRIDTVCDMIAHLAKSPEFQTSQQGVEYLHDISLESEVKAAIASDDKIWIENITVKATNHNVTVAGFVRNKTVKEAIIDTVKHVKGVEQCNFNLELKTDPINLKFE